MRVPHLYNPDLDIGLSPLESKESVEWARQMRNHPETRSFLANTDEISKKEQRAWFKSLQTSKTSFRILVHHRGETVGLIRLDHYDEKNKSICVGMDIHPDHRGQGLSSTVYEMLFQFLFDGSAALHRVWLLVGAYNERAIHIYKKLGFVEEGCQRQALLRDGKYWDQYMMSILKEEYNERY